MRKTKTRVLNLFMILLLVFISYSVITYAWTNNTYYYNQEIIGKSRKTYFAGGDGTPVNPFIISEPVHMFNLAYLQNLGIFDSIPDNWYVDDNPANALKTGIVHYGVTNFDGNDAIALVKNGTPIDVLGTIGNSSVFAQNVTLVRNSGVYNPNTTYTPSEWTSYLEDNTDSVGSHTLISTSDLIVSEYGEGSENNKWIELYNGTGVSVDLSTSNYSIQLYSDGSSTATETLDLSQYDITLADGETLVITNPATSLSKVEIATDIFDDWSTPIYYFAVGNIIGYSGTDGLGNPIPVIESTVINFSNDAYQTLPPIGTDDHPFISVFDGNNSVIENYIIDGNYYDDVELQDVGTFGYIGIESAIQNVSFKNPTILSNTPDASYDRTSYHVHNDGRKNIATGYVAGHVAGNEIYGPLLKDIYVATNPMTDTSGTYSADLSSTDNNVRNRTQYGFIGYTEANLGEIPGGPEDQQYSFALSAVKTEAFLVYAYTNFGSWYVNGSSTITLNSILTYNAGNPAQEFRLDLGYSLSTITLTKPDNSVQDVNMYDYVTAYGLSQPTPVDVRIGSSATGYYNVDNIDLIGEILLGIEPSSGTKQFYFTATSYQTPPSVSSSFDPNDYPYTILLYVKPTNDPNDLGQITYSYTGASGLILFSPTGTSGIIDILGNTHTLAASEAYCAIDRSVDPQTGQVTQTVVDSSAGTPDYYVYLVAAPNGKTKIFSINFEYTPVQVNADSLSSIANMALVYDVADGDDLYALDGDGFSIGDPIPTGTILQADGYPDPSEVNHNITYFNFSYELEVSQQMVITAEKMAIATPENPPDIFDYKLYFNNIDVNSTFISVFIINIHRDNIHLNIEGSDYGTTYDEDIIVVTIEYNGTNNYISSVDTTTYQ